MNITTATHSCPRPWRWGVAAGLAASLLGVHAAAHAGPGWSVGVGAPALAVQVRGGGHGGPHAGVHGHYAGPRGYYGGYRGWRAGHGGYRGSYGWRGPGWSVWGPAIGIGIGLPLAVYEVEREPVYVAAAPVAPPPPSAPDPVVYPRNDQTPQQAESDRRACDRWATTQPAAMADASVFHRSVEACMDARGYTVR